MNVLKRGRLWLLLLIPITLIIKFTAFLLPSVVEKFYSGGIYKFLSQGISCIVGFFPFSVFEVVCYVLLAFLLCYTLYFIGALIIKDDRIFTILSYVTNLLVIISIGFFLNTAFYGINQYRIDLIDTLAFDVKRDVAKNDIINLAEDMIEKTNQSREKLNKNYDKLMQNTPENLAKIEQISAECFNKSNTRYVFLDGLYGKPKQFFFPSVMSILNDVGCYSPLLFEVSYNNNAPTLPIINSVCENLAKMRGITDENEAKFIAYAVCTSSGDDRFIYAGYYLATRLILNEILYENSQQYQQLYEKLSQDVKQDFAEYDVYFDSDLKTGYKTSKAENSKEFITYKNEFLNLILAEYLEK